MIFCGPLYRMKLHVHAKYELYLVKHVVRRSAHIQQYHRSGDL